MSTFAEKLGFSPAAAATFSRLAPAPSTPRIEYPDAFTSRQCGSYRTVFAPPMNRETKREAKRIFGAGKPSFVAKRGMHFDAKKAVISNVTQDTVEMHCFQAGTEFAKKLGYEAIEMFRIVAEDKQISRRLAKDSRLRLAWAGYVARTLFSHGREVPTCYLPGNEAGNCDYLHFARELGYDRDAELGQSIVIALSGDMETDLATNFVARNLSKMPVGEFRHHMASLYTEAFASAAACIISGMHGSELIPRVETTAAGIEKFFDELMSVPAPKNNDLWNYAREASLSAIWNGNAQMRTSLTAPASVSMKDGTIVSTILPGYTTVDTRPGTPSENSSFGPCYQRIFGDEVRTNDAYDENAEPVTISFNEASMLQSAFKEDAAIWAERRALEAARQARSENRKAQKRIKELEAKLAKALSEIDRLKGATAPASGKIIVEAGDMESLKRQLQKYETRAIRLEKENADLNANTENIATARREVAELRQKLAERDAQFDALVRSLEADEDEQAEDEAVVDTSVFDDHSILVVGGHPNLGRVLQEVSPSIRFFGTRRPPDDAVFHADMVWFQTNFISHKTSVPILDICRQYNIPVRFLRGTGLVPNRNQIVRETQAFFNSAGLAGEAAQ